MPIPSAVSVIIPTYNRASLLRETLSSLAQQTYPYDWFEVIVVDDGSTDTTKQIEGEAFPFTLRYFRQDNHGDAVARNFGAQQSRADILAFLDDDISVESEYLACLVCEHELHDNRIVVGTAILRAEEATLLAKTVNAPTASANSHGVGELVFTDLCSNSMSLRREAYFKVGMMQSLGFPGSSMWCDVDFAYRAYRQGFEFRRCIKAVYWHQDHVVRSLDSYTKRIKTAASRAVVLFQKYPELLPHLPMFDDKTPIIWGQDSPYLIARKLARRLASTSLVLWSMERLVNALEKGCPACKALYSLYRWIIGGHIFQGYREGLRKFGQAGARE